jgi:cellulose synthase (UDP-forming)
MRSLFIYDKYRINFFFRIKNNLKLIITLFSLIMFITILLFLSSNFYPILINAKLSLLEKGISVVLLTSFLYSGLHCVGYIDHLIKSLTIYDNQLVTNNKAIMASKGSLVAIIIPTLNENPDMVKETILKAKNVDYENFQVILIDSSTDNEIRDKTAIMCHEMDIKYIYRDNLRGYKAGSINDAIKNLNNNFKYVLILDSDHRLKSSVFKDLIPIMENDPDLTFIQTPQYFRISENDRLGLAYSFQQHIFYKHICRGLCVNETAYICGTNVIIKLKDLKKIGGMDESCITEDIATSFIFHTKGYKSLYIDKVYAEGLAPPSLSAYYGQQLRWSYGTFQNTKKVLKKAIKEPNSLKSLQWWEYIVLNGSWYFIGVAIFIWLLYPVSVLMFNLKPLVLGPLNIPFYLFLLMIITQTVTSYRERGYPLKELILAQALFFSLFPVYTKALIYGLTNKKLKFKVTPKKGKYKTAFKEILPQLFVMLLLTISIIIGIIKLISGKNTTTYPSIIIWASYSLIMIVIFLIYFYKEDNKKNIIG